MDNFFDDFDLAVKNLQRKEDAVDDLDNEAEDLHSKLNKLLKINQRMQHFLQQFMEYLNEQMDKNLVEQTACQIKISESKKKARYRPPHVFASPYFRDSKGFHSPLNEETITKKEHLYANARVSPSHQWNSAMEQSTFVRIVEANGREVLEKPWKRRMAFLVEKRERNLQGPDVMEEIAREIRELREKIDVLREQTFEHLLEEETFELDWLSISTSMLENGFDRDAKACELMWENFLQPNINRQEFTPEEDNTIIKLTSKGETNWTEIAVCLKTNRTAFQCFVRFQRKLNKNLRNRCWTEEEDAKLIQVVEFCRVRDIIPWKKVLLYMKGWSMPQLQNRWDRNLKPQNREGKWTPEEDAILLLAVPCVGRCWMQICTLLHGRTSYFCRERYINTLDPTLHTGEWTWQEDKLLLCLLATHGEKWGTISRFLKGRTDNMVNQRCAVMKRYKPLLYKRVLASNPDDVRSILPKKQFARSNVCTDVNARREKRREEAFKLAFNAMQTYYGSSFDASAYSTFEQLATCLNNNKESLRQVAKILLSKFPTVTMKRPVSHYSYKCQMKVEARDTDGDEDEEWHSDTDRDEDKEMDDEMQEDCEEIVVKEEETMTQEEIRKLNFEFNDFILPTAAISSRYVVLTRMVKKTRTQFEYSAMLRCLLDYYRCNGKKSKTRDMDEEAENSDEEFIYRRVDFGRIVPRVIEMFVIGTLSKDLPPIIPPNRSTSDSFNMMLIGHINNISTKLDQITEDQNLILCALVNEFDFQKMKSKMDCPICKAYKRVDMDESGSSNTSILCPKCTDEYYIDNLVALFWHRFFVLFAFPTVLSQCKPSKRQLQFVMQNPGHFFHRINKRSVARGVKRVYCSDDSSSNSEENFDDDSEDEDYLCQ